MSLVPQDWDHLRKALDEAADGVAKLLRSAKDANAKVAGLDWTVGELGAHIVTEAGRFDRFGGGEHLTLPSTGVATLNEQDNATITERDPAKLADMFLALHRAYAAQAKQHVGDEAFDWFGFDLTWASAAGIYLGELNVHAFDLARTLGTRWTIARDDALQIAYGLFSILPSFVDPDGAKGFSGSYLLKLRGGTPVALRFDNGALTVERPNGARTDCTINADPESFLLVGYGRKSQWFPILTGKIMAGGRKPWLGLKFNTLLANP